MDEQHQSKGQHHRELNRHQSPVQTNTEGRLNTVRPPCWNFRGRGHRPTDEAKEKRERRQHQGEPKPPGQQLLVEAVQHLLGLTQPVGHGALLLAVHGETSTSCV